jgi:ubiquitin C-terminal hydrolase
VKPLDATGSNQINCPFCDRKTDSTQSYSYLNAPPVLCFGINRFQIDFRRGRRVKLTSPLSFPIEFDFKPFLQREASSDEKDADQETPETLYDLCAVTIHSVRLLRCGGGTVLVPDRTFTVVTMTRDGGGSAVFMHGIVRDCACMCVGYDCV